MEKVNIYHFTSYKEFLKTFISSNKEVRGIQSQLADAGGCQKTYLSQVLSGKSQLTPEHGIGLSLYLKLNPEEQDYFLNLIHFERAGTPQLQKYYQSKLEEQLLKSEKIENKISAPTLDITYQTIYYSSWIYPALHVAVSIPELQTVSQLSKRFLIPDNEIQCYLEKMRDMGLIIQKDKKWVSKIPNIHLPESSPLVWLNHQNWRRRAQQEGDKINSSGLHYSTVSSLSHKDALLLRSLVIDFIQSTRKIIEPSKEEEIVALLIDYFPL